MINKWGAWLRDLEMSKLAAGIIACGTLANVLFNAVMNALGYHYPYTTFLFQPGNRWSDFFGLAFSYPLGAIHPNTIPFMADHLEMIKALADSLRGTSINPDHMLPLATLLALIVRLGMTIVSPLGVFAMCIAMAAGVYVAMIKAMVADPVQRSAWRAAGLLSYPVIFMFDRGHMFAFICAVTLMWACWRMLRDRKLDTTSIVLLAVAANLRPNVLILPAILFLALRIGRWRDQVRLGIVGLCLLVLTLGAANAIYPHYNPSTWLKGMEDYRRLYVEHPLSSGFTSSLSSALNLVFGYHAAFGSLCLAAGAIVGGLACLMGRSGRLTDAQVLFLALAVMPIGLPAFGDYHLLPFLLPPVMMARKAQRISPSDWTIFAASMVLLIPKNYVYGSDWELDPWSWQVVVNPLVALVASGIVLARAAGSRVAGPGEDQASSWSSSWWQSVRQHFQFAIMR